MFGGRSEGMGGNVQIKLFLLNPEFTLSSLCGNVEFAQYYIFPVMPLEEMVGIDSGTVWVNIKWKKSSNSSSRHS